MKIRQGFVSNSSSSSFVVAVKDSSKVILTIEVDLNKFADHVLCDEEEVRQYFNDEYEYELKEKEDWVLKRMEQCLQAVKDGKKVLIGSFSSEGEEAVEQFLCENGLPSSPGLDIIESSGGY